MPIWILLLYLSTFWNCSWCSVVRACRICSSGGLCQLIKRSPSWLVAFWVGLLATSWSHWSWPFAQQVQFRQWKFMFHSSSAFIYAQQKSVIAYTEKHRKQWKSATDYCPSCMRQRREPVWEHLPLMQSLLLVTVHGCKFPFLVPTKGSTFYQSYFVSQIWRKGVLPLSTQIRPNMLFTRLMYPYI